MIKVVIVDDEALLLNNLKCMFKQMKSVEVVGSFQQPHLALENIIQLQPNLIISDIFMNQFEGLEFAQKATDLVPDAKIVFLTDHDKYAVRAFELGAFDYIMKPVSKERLNKMISRLNDELENSSAKDNGSKHQQDSKHNNFICVNKGDSIVVINKLEIMYCYASNKKTYVYIDEGCYECKYTLEQLEQILDNFGFFRCHRGYIVNLRYIREIAPMFNQTYIIRLKNMRVDIPVSRNYALKMKDLLKF